MPEMLEARRHLHQHPELSFQEQETADYLCKWLDQWGISYQRNIAGHGIFAKITGSRPGKNRIIALRADMDALPIQEQTQLEFQSTSKGVMHACGHDIHMTSLLGTAFLLQQMRHEYSGTILLLFQPGEEQIPGGARQMLEAGVFAEYQPELVIGQHVLPEMEAGKAGFKAGMFMASSDEIYITLKGKGGHAALPHLLDDTVSAAAHVIVNLQQVVSRKSPAYIPSVLSFGKVIANGANNIIPDEVSIAGTFRTMNEDWRAEAKELIRSIAVKTAESMGVRCDVNILDGYPFLVNDEKATHGSMNIARDFLGDTNVEELHIRMTAEDFAYFSQAYPSVFYRLGTRKPGSSDFYPLHSSRFEVDESSIETGIGLMTYLALQQLAQ